MNINKNEKKGIPRRLLAIVSAAVLVLSLQATAAPWDLGVTADLGVTHTNNVLLAPEDQEESETVYMVVPTFTLATDGERTQADIRYRAEGYFYSDLNDADDVFHTVDASLTTALVSDRLFLSLLGTRFQTITNPDLSFPTSNLPVTRNRVDSTVLEIRPYWQQQLGGAALRIEAGYQDLEYDGNEFQSAVEKDAAFRLDNFKQQEGIAWGLEYSYRRLEYGDSQPFDFQRAGLNLGFWVNGALRLFGAGGAETSFDNILDSNLDDEFWEVGFQYTPNQRMSLELAAGERSYGSSFRGDFSFKLRRGSLAITYNETPSTRAETAFGTRPLVGDDILDQILDRPGNADRFVRKRGQARLAIELNKSELGIRVFSEERDSRVAESAESLGDESLSGLAVDWQWNFGARTRLDLSADIASRDNGIDKDELTGFSLGIAYELGPKTSLRLEGRRSEQAGGQQGDYTENQGRLVLQARLL